MLKLEEQKAKSIQLNLMIFYYKFLLSKYFKELSLHAKFNKKMRKNCLAIKGKNELKLLKFGFFGLKGAKEVNLIEKKEVDLLTKKIL